jgi:hypothetical protein
MYGHDKKAKIRPFWGKGPDPVKKLFTFSLTEKSANGKR